MLNNINIADKSKYIVDNFERAIKEGWIDVYYQPIIRAANGLVSDEEALARWDDPVFGIMNPGDFIPILEAVNLIHVLDLYVLDQVLLKMKKQADVGLYVVPIAVNLSQVDFFSCDIVEEVKNRVIASEIPIENVVIEIKAFAIKRNNEQVFKRIQQLQDLGFKIWIDDYGGDDFSPQILHHLHFDLLKIDMSYLQQISYSSAARIVITELVKLAISLGIDTVAEGVEYEEQMNFLKDVGCTKLQGYYFCRPVSREQIFERYKNGKAIGFENPEETDYYSAVGKINLYDLSFTSDDSEHEGIDNYFETLPMAIVEVNDEIITYMRGNKTFVKVLDILFPIRGNQNTYRYKDAGNVPGAYAMNAIGQCAKNGGKQIIDERTKDGRTVQLLLQKIAENKVTKMTAVAVVFLSVTDSVNIDENLTYNYIARALSEDYLYMYFVDMVTEDFVEYSSDGANFDVSVERKGVNFFKTAYEDAKRRIYKEDLEEFTRNFTKENIKSSIEKNGVYTQTYRLDMDGTPTYVHMKVVSTRAGMQKIIIGVSNVDAQKKEHEIVERIKEERKSFARISALSGDFICIYAVDPITDHYIRYKSSDDYDTLNREEEAGDFFGRARHDSESSIYPEDLPNFLNAFDKKNIIEQISATGMFVINYRLVLKGIPRFVCLKATIVEESDGPQLIIGVIDVDKQVKKELEYAENLLAAETKAKRDELTHVKNKYAYAQDEESLNQILEEHHDLPVAVIVSDINDLKTINDSLGHQAGDEYIKKGCEILCDIFSKSPVYRIGGDEFVIISQGKDYQQLEDKIAKVHKINRKNKKMHDITMAIGYARNEGDKKIADIFARADSNMYANKKQMKES